MPNQAMRLIEFTDLQTIKDALCTGLAFYDSYGERQIHPNISVALDIVNAAMKTPGAAEAKPPADPRIVSFDEWLTEQIQECEATINNPEEFNTNKLDAISEANTWEAAQAEFRKRFYAQS